MKKTKTKPISARIDSDLLEEVNKDGIPTSKVVEALLRYYSKLNEDEKKKILIENIDFSSTVSKSDFVLTNKQLKLVPLGTLAILLNPAWLSAVTAAGVFSADKLLQGVKHLSKLKKNDDKE